MWDESELTTATDPVGIMTRAALLDIMPLKKTIKK